MTLVWDFVHIPQVLFHGVKMCCAAAVPQLLLPEPRGPPSHTVPSLSPSPGPALAPCA